MNSEIYCYVEGQVSGDICTPIFVYEDVVNVRHVERNKRARRRLVTHRHLAFLLLYNI